MINLRNSYQNYRLKRHFSRVRRKSRLSHRNGNALIISTGSSYSKFSLQDIRKEIKKNNITTVIGLNNLMLYDPYVEQILTDYIIIR